MKVMAAALAACVLLFAGYGSKLWMKLLPTQGSVGSVRVINLGEKAATSAPTNRGQDAGKASPVQQRQQPAAKKRKNILFIVIDDFSAKHYPEMRTPHMQAFEDTAVSFKRAYTQWPQCAPSRASFTTGRYPLSLKKYAAELHSSDDDQLSFFKYEKDDSATGAFRVTSKGAKEDDFPRALSNAGYRTAIAGKVYHANGALLPLDTFNETDFSNRGVVQRNRAKDIFQFRGCKDLTKPCECEDYVEGDPAEAACVDAVTALLGEGWIRDWAAIKEPWAIFLGFVRPHTPYRIPSKYWERHNILSPSVASDDMKNVPHIALQSLDWGSYRSCKAQWNACRQTYARAVEYVDDLFGSVIGALEESRQTDDTIVILTSDHGVSMGEHNLGGKWNLFEDTLRVPLMVRHPDAAAASTDAIVELADLYPTLLNLAGVNPGKRRDGVDFSDVLFSPKRSLRTSAISFWVRCGQNRPCTTVRSGALRVDFAGISIRTANARYTQWAPVDSSAAKQCLLLLSEEACKEKPLCNWQWDGVPGFADFHDQPLPWSRENPVVVKPEGKFRCLVDPFRAAAWDDGDSVIEEAYDHSEDDRELVNIASSSGSLMSTVRAEFARRRESALRFEDEGTAAEAHAETDSSEGAKQPRNIMLVMFDDLRTSLSPYVDEANAVRRLGNTPRLDTFASESSVLFEKAFCQQTVCAPSRKSMWTARRLDSIARDAQSSSAYTFDAWPKSLVESTMVTWFGDRGFHTFGVGKLFHNEAPLAFDEYIRLDNQNKEASSAIQVQLEPRAPWGGSNRWFCRDCDDVTCNDKKNCVDAVVSRRTQQFLKRWAESPRSNSTPFFAGVGFHRPHAAYASPRSFQLDSSKNRTVDDLPKRQLVNVCGDTDNKIPNIACKAPHTRAEFSEREYDAFKALRLSEYEAAVSWVDKQFGNVIDALKNHGFWENTIVVVVSDHGYHMGEHDLWGKFTLFEPASRVPLLVRVPGSKGLQYGARATSIVELTDIFPTLADLVSPLTMPLSVAGQSFASLFRKGAHERMAVRPFALTQYPRCEGQYSKPYQRYECTMIKERKARIDHMGYSVRTRNWRYTAWLRWNRKQNKPVMYSGLLEDADFEELYDHEGDDGTNYDNFEIRNVIDMYPQVAAHLRNILRIEIMRVVEGSESELPCNGFDIDLDGVTCLRPVKKVIASERSFWPCDIDAFTPEKKLEFKRAFAAKRGNVAPEHIRIEHVREATSASIVFDAVVIK